VHELSDIRPDAPSTSDDPIDAQARAQADGATVPYPDAVPAAQRTPAPRAPAIELRGNWDGRTPW
jgi:hypothetical protein